MTHDVFLSWSSDDAAAIGPLKDLLADVGVRVWEYSDDSQAGGLIPQQVSDAIDAAKDSDIPDEAKAQLEEAQKQLEAANAGQ